MRLFRGPGSDCRVVHPALLERGTYTRRRTRRALCEAVVLVLRVFVLLKVCRVCVKGRSVHTYNMLVETRYLCNPVKSSDNVYGALDNKLIYLSGKLATDGPVTDNQYGVTGKSLH